MTEEESNSSERLLEHLHGSKYEVVPSQPDINGWWVTDEQGGKIGHIDDLLFEPATRKVQYLVVSLADNDFDLKSKSVLIPIDIVDLRETDVLVVVPNVTPELLSSLPDYRKELLNQGAVEETNGIFARLQTGAGKSKSPDDQTSHNNGLQTFRDGQIEIKLYREVPVVVREKSNFMKEKEPFEIYIDGEMLTVIPQDETYMVYKGMSKLGDIMPHQDDSGLVWVSGDLIPLDYLEQIGKQIESSSAWNQIKSD